MQRVLPWAELMFRRNPGAYVPLVRLLRERAAQDPSMAEAIDVLQPIADRVRGDYKPDVWFMRARGG